MILFVWLMLIVFTRLANGLDIYTEHLSPSSGTTYRSRVGRFNMSGHPVYMQFEFEIIQKNELLSF